PSTISGARLRNLLGIDRMSSAIRHSFDCVAACARILGMLFTELTPSVVRRRLFQSTYISSQSKVRMLICSCSNPVSKTFPDVP
ncbi:hypothetical protein PISMIDRAFT_684646, partial [Pisolithus microcarpus 441]